MATHTAKRLAVKHNVEIIDPYGICESYLKALEAVGIKVHVLLPRTKNFYIGYRGNKIKRLWRMFCQIPVVYRLRKRLINKINQIKPDVIWTNSELALMLLTSSSQLCRYPVVLYACGCPAAVSIRKWRRWIIRKRPAIIMTSSTETAKQLQLMGVGAERIKVVFETIDFSAVLRESTKPLESPLPGMDGYPRIIVPATLLFTKGQHTAIKAVAHFTAKGWNPTLWLAGDVTGNDKSYLYHLESLIKRLGISKNVYLLGWRHDVPAIILRSDIVVLPTHTEGFGRVTLEAMLLRRPAVTTPAGGMKDSIEHEYDGLFFPVDDDHALAQHLMRLATDKKFMSKLVENGYKTATEKFNPEKHTERVLDAFCCAINAKTTKTT